MGTNYYLHENVCGHCGRGDKPLHIGKSSAGWCFALHIDPENGIHTLNDWIARWSKEGVEIRDEYEEKVSPDKMLQVITERSFGDFEGKRGRIPPTGYGSWGEYLSSNDAEEGPGGLLRHRVGVFCAKHGDGPYDLVVGEFC